MVGSFTTRGKYEIYTNSLYILRFDETTETFPCLFPPISRLTSIPVENEHDLMKRHSFQGNELHFRLYVMKASATRGIKTFLLVRLSNRVITITAEKKVELFLRN